MCEFSGPVVWAWARCVRTPKKWFPKGSLATRFFLGGKRTLFKLPHSIHGTAIFTYIFHQNPPNAGRPWMVWVLREVVFTIGVLLSPEKKNKAPHQRRDNPRRKSIFPIADLAWKMSHFFLESGSVGLRVSAPCFCMIKIYHYPKEASTL